MSYADVLLTIVTVILVLMAARSLRPTTKRRHFKARVEQTDRSIWDLEFAKEKYKMLREDVRQQYDRINENVVQAKGRLEEEQKKETPDAKTVEHFQNLVTRYEPDIEYLKKQMDALDQQIDCPENPESATQKIEASRALQEMLKAHIRKL